MKTNVYPIFVLTLSFVFVMNIAMPTQATRPQDGAPPIAKTKPHELKIHGHTRIDDYFWLNQRTDSEVIDYLNAENAYLESQLAPTQKLQEQLFAETKARIKQDDQSVPVPDHGYEYYSRTVEGQQYSVYCRKKLTTKDDTSTTDAATSEEETAKTPMEPMEEVLLDVNVIADGHEYCAARIRVNENGALMAIISDFVGRRKYTLEIKNLETGEMLSDRIEDITGNMVWASDNKHLFYTRQDPKTLRSYQIFRHELGTDANRDVLVYQEDDEEFSCSLSKSRSRDIIFISSQQTLSSEYLYIESATPVQEPKVIIPRRRNHEYSVDHLDGQFFIMTNDKARNFRLVTTPQAETAEKFWIEIVPHDENALLEGFDLFAKYMVVDHRRGGLTRLTIMPWDNNIEAHELEFGEACYVAGTSVTPDTKTGWIRYQFASMKTPPSVFEYHVGSRKKRLLKTQEVLGGFDSENYKTERVWADANDGTKIPVSILYHKDTPIDGTAPCLEYAYGSYGYSTESGFNSTRLNLVDRGFVYAIAHIRGGSEMGRHWYEDGKLLKKMNTFTDFCDVGDFLIKNKYAGAKRLYARGGSAGGLLMGAVINLRPELYDGVIADVPFVDVVTTMLDDTIPLTTSEYDEWGNPNDEEYYKYMLSYSPYDNVATVEYPNLLVTTGLHDSQVQYWEPAKWVAKLRVNKKDNNMLLLKTNMDAGHGGSSGRYDRYKETALRHAFLIHLSNRNDH